MTQLDSATETAARAAKTVAAAATLGELAVVAAQTAGFKLHDLAQRRVQELGSSVRATFFLHRWALIPSLIWAAVFVRPEHLAFVWQQPQLLAYLVLIAVSWNLQAFLSVYLLNATEAISFLALVEKLIYLPMLLAVGIVMNGDSPNAWSLISLALLGLALWIQSSHHTRHRATIFRYSVLATLGAIVLRTAIDAVNNGMSREVAQALPVPVFIGLFTVLTLGITAGLYYCVPRKIAACRIPKEKRWMAFLIPAVWFAATIPESYALSALPIYTLVSLGALGFLVDVASDLRNKRIPWNGHTAAFTACTLAGLATAVLSI